MPYRDPINDGPEVLFPGDTIHLSGLKDARSRAGMSREQLARTAQVPLDEVSAIEKYNGRVLVLTAMKLARALGVSLDDLRAVVPQPAPPPKSAEEPSGASATEQTSRALPKTKSA